MAADAEPGPREIRLVTPRGVTNPLVFHVGQVPEVARKPMPTCPLPGARQGAAGPAQPTAGRGGSAHHRAVHHERPDRLRRSEPVSVRGARKGQRLVISVAARQLIPYIADAVPGWFQPVLTLSDAEGKEVAYNDDYRFKPDPTIFFEVPDDGEYVLAITDAIFRGREDFVYRVTIGELPFVTSIFPLGGRVGRPGDNRHAGLESRERRIDAAPPRTRGPGTYADRRSEQGGIRLQPRALRARHAAGMRRQGIQQRPVARADGAAARHRQRAHRSSAATGTCFESRAGPATRSSPKSTRGGSIRRSIPCSNSPTRPARCWRSTTITKTRDRA